MACVGAARSPVHQGWDSADSSHQSDDMAFGMDFDVDPDSKPVTGHFTRSAPGREDLHMVVCDPRLQEALAPSVSWRRRLGMIFKASQWPSTPPLTAIPVQTLARRSSPIGIAHAPLRRSDRPPVPGPRAHKLGWSTIPRQQASRLCRGLGRCCGRSCPPSRWSSCEARRSAMDSRATSSRP